MGLWNFYIEIKVESNDAKILLQEYNSNDLYQSAFHFGIVEEWLDSEFNAGISSVIDNFLPANHLIFNFLSVIREKREGFLIKTNGIKRLFDFDKKADFLNFMYNTWEDKIESAYRQVGSIIINQKHYFKSRNKLYKKYYKKF